MFLPRLANSGSFLDFQYQGGVKSTVSGVFEDTAYIRLKWSGH